MLLFSIAIVVQFGMSPRGRGTVGGAAADAALVAGQACKSYHRDTSFLEVANGS
jgi:hypothetical protein